MKDPNKISKKEAERQERQVLRAACDQARAALAEATKKPPAEYGNWSATRTDVWIARQIRAVRLLARKPPVLKRPVLKRPALKRHANALNQARGFLAEVGTLQIETLITQELLSVEEDAA